MGGKNPTIVLADADFNSAVENVVNAAFFSTGQKCTATSRAIVEDAIYDASWRPWWSAREAEGRRRHAAGHRDRPRVDQAGWRPMLALHRDRPQGSGRTALRRPPPYRRRLRQGFFVEPTVFADVAEDHAIAREEIFGPVLAIMRASDFEDAMRIANCIPFGLSSSIQTTNLSRVFEYIYRAEAGLLTVNLPSAGVEYQLPFGGIERLQLRPQRTRTGRPGIL